MDYDELAELGSQTARSGFRNEDDIVDKFNAWETDSDSRRWLVIMGYQLNEIDSVRAEKISGQKADVQVQVTIQLRNLIDSQNIQVKLVSNPQGFNQIDKRWTDSYIDLWNIPATIVSILKRFTGELPPTIPNPRDGRRMFADEFPANEQTTLLNWLTQNQTLIVNDILKGRGQFAAEWILVVQKVRRNARWILKPINFALNYFGNGPIVITNRGSIKIGKITVQRKGGDAGRDTAKMLQFKINPAKLFDA